jgi:hypothetical protein
LEASIPTMARSGACLAGGRESGGLDDHGGAIAENFGRAYHRPGIVSNAHDCICAELSRVCDHQLKRFIPCGFTKIRKYSGSPTKERPETTHYTQG